MKTKEINHKEEISKKIKVLELLVKPTTSDLRQFETNCRNVFMIDLLKNNLDRFQELENYIGEEIYKYKKSFNYSKAINTDYLNTTEDTPILFTKELFEEFKLNAINYWIQYHSEDLIKRKITQNSTHKLSNLEFEWHLEMKQELIKFYNSLIGNIYF